MYNHEIHAALLFGSDFLYFQPRIIAPKGTLKNKMSQRNAKKSFAKFGRAGHRTNSSYQYRAHPRTTSGECNCNGTLSCGHPRERERIPKLPKNSHFFDPTPD
jgi:hypothetical protein